jgi:hypothetical protein
VLRQFQLAYDAPWFGLDRRLQVDDRPCGRE